MKKMFKLGCAGLGIQASSMERPVSLVELPILEQFKLVKEAQVWDFIDRIPNNRQELDEYIKGSQLYDLPVLSGSGCYTLGLDEAVTASTNGRLVIATIHVRDIPDALSRISTWCAELPNNNDLLADGLSAVIWQTIKRQPGQPGRLMVKTLSIGAGDTGIRAKIRKGEFGQLHQDIEQQLRQASWSTENLFGGTRT